MRKITSNITVEVIAVFLSFAVSIVTTSVTIGVDKGTILTRLNVYEKDIDKLDIKYDIVLEHISDIKESIHKIELNIASKN